MKKKLLLLGVAVLVFQVNIKAQNTTALERKASPKKFTSVKNGKIQKKEFIKEDKNIPLKGYAPKIPNSIEETSMINKTVAKKKSLLKEIDLKISTLKKKMASTTYVVAINRYKKIMNELLSEKQLILSK